WIRVGEAQLLTMRTPGDDDHLVLGFLLGEGVIERPEDVVRQTFTAGDASKLRPDACDVELRPGAAARVGGRLTRTHEVRPSCGVCGLTDAAALLDELPPLLPGVPRVPVPELQAMQERFAATQECFRATGACHGAAIYGGDGE